MRLSEAGSTSPCEALLAVGDTTYVPDGHVVHARVWDTAETSVFTFHLQLNWLCWSCSGHGWSYGHCQAVVVLPDQGRVSTSKFRLLRLPACLILLH